MSGSEGATQLIGAPVEAWSVPIFRTVTTPTGRHALRLEGVFWDAIARMAIRQNRKASELVRDLLGAAESNASNLSSGIRSVIVRRLLDEDERLSVLAEPLAMVKLMQMAPTPSFALDRNKHLVRVNDEFVRYLRTVMSRSGPAEKAQLRLERPAESIFAEVEPGTAVECGVSIVVDNHERRTQARIIVPPPQPANVLVGYILS
ncbi:Predicted DNA-binding protein, contains Ribbon-helix-helix (RHH) domain [Devosia lucknowensis]|uniref:Predicted DNA-binding protein, contains Ribbon-helix-helix (RHH) domain n=1 Tax=Devosia lucknowensis TaxID=1096929 RepID=A0A1Y6ED20_9HYPH|nr:ribbon-helix-helix domain-containing protein [Devosia lucknowensis]SMQ60366.1 Predicted DNA-binding protein, contains Ribbon-helix-helix (RHH) domain [Devosia lucknowensis]